MNDLRNALTEDEQLDEFEPAPLPTEKDLAKVVTLARDQLRLELTIEKTEALLAQLKEQLRAISQNTLPLALQEIGLTGLPLLGGYAITMKDVIGGHISKENAPKAHAWLEESGNGAIVKHVITIQFGKGDEAWYKKFVRDLAQRKRPLRYERKDSVHPQTLSAFVREQVAAAKTQGLDPAKLMPLDLLGVYQLKVTEVERPKAAEATL